MSESRIIKKYPNRRLYDTAVSRYITLGDVRRLVLEHVDFQVKDARTEEDITRNILLQIIIEREEDGEPIFSTEVLEEIIRFYGDTLQGVIASYLEKSMRLFVQQQHALRDRLENVMVGDPLTFMRDLTEQNLHLWQEMQENFFKSATGVARGASPTAKKDDEDGGGRSKK